jgi:glycerol-3-phosphate dehydrogenase subunit B
MEHSPALSGQSDVLVVGAGLSGLSAAWQAAARGKRTRLIAKGHGALYWNAGCIDVLGYHPIDSATPLESPIEGIASLISANPGHPYALAGLEAIADALSAFQELSAAAGYPMPGSLERNWLLPSALGTFRPTCLAPETMVNGDLHRVDPMLIIGFEGFQDFYPELMAANLSIQGIRAAGATLDIPELQNHRIITGRILAELFETPEFIVQLAKAVKDELGKVSHSCIARVGFPAVFGLNSPLHAKRSLEDEIGLPVFEIPTLPPSIPGIRLSRLLINAIQSSGGRFFEGMQAMAAEKDPQGQLSSIWSEASARRKSHRAANFILATGGILGGGFSAAYEGNVSEVICGLPISAPADRNQWINRQFLGSEAHPIFRSGIQVDANFQPIDPANKVIHNNLYAVGTGLANADFLRERSFDGVALVTGYLVGKTF